MFPLDVFDPTTLAVIGVALMPQVSGITQLFKESFPEFLVGVRVRWFAALVGVVLFSMFAGTQLAPAPWSQILTWVYGAVVFSLATSGNVDLAKQLISKSSNPLNEVVG